MTLRPDNRLADAPMTPIRCRRCGSRVLARKSSWDQTSVQWDAAALEDCVERSHAMQWAEHGPRRLFLACGALHDTIIEAVRDGELSVVEDASLRE